MTDRDKQIIEETTKAVKDNLGAGCYVGDLLNIIISLQAENKILKSKVDSYDVFYFCSYSGCEAVSSDCWKTCPNSVYNKTKAKAYKEFADSATDLCYKEFGNEMLVAHTFAAIVSQTLNNFLKEMER